MMMMFLALAHMCDATQLMGGGGGDDVPCTCTHVNHSAGEFERIERFRNKSLSVHTGTIDSCWKQMKTHIPKSLGSQSKQVPLGIRSWQWRFTHADHSDLFSLCGTQVAKM